MTTVKSVLGVLGLCRVVLPTQHTFNPVITGLSGQCVGCVGFTRPRAHVREKIHSGLSVGGAAFFFYARPKKPDTPNTPNTNMLNALFLKAFICVGFVSGWAFLCRVGGAA